MVRNCVSVGAVSPQPRGAGSGAHLQLGAGEAVCRQVWCGCQALQGHLLLRPLTGNDCFSLFFFYILAPYWELVLCFAEPCEQAVSVVSWWVSNTHHGKSSHHLNTWWDDCDKQGSLKTFAIVDNIADPVLHNLHHCPGQQLPGNGGRSDEYQGTVLAARHHHQH